MGAKPSLRELQTEFLAALYDDGAPGPVNRILRNSLASEARLRIYRRSCHAIQTGALRTTYPAILALVGEDWFDQAARRYRRHCPSHTGNLQELGARFANFLETIPPRRTLSYLADVARLEWLRQEAILAADSRILTFDDFMTCLEGPGEPLRVSLHNCVHLLSSQHPVLTIWRFALDPHGDLDVDGQGENVMLWREAGEVTMTRVDMASYTYITALVAGASLEIAAMSAVARDERFDPAQCMNELIGHHLVADVLPCPITENREITHDSFCADKLFD